MAGKLKRPSLPTLSKAVLVPAITPPAVLFGVCLIISAIMVGISGGDILRWWPLSSALWMTVYHVPFYGIGPTGFLAIIGFLPLLPVLLYVAALAWSTRRFTDGFGTAELKTYTATATVLPTLWAVLLWGSMHATRETLYIQPPNLAVVIGSVVGVTMLGIILGLRERMMLIIPFAKESFPAWGRAGFALAGRLLLMMVAAGAWIGFLALCVHWTLLGEVLSYGGGAAGILGFALLSILYLPNLAVGAAVIVAGGGIQVGLTQVSLYSVHVEQIPGFPLFAALPTKGGQWWWMVLLIIPAVITILATRTVTGPTVLDRVKAVLFAVPTTAVLAALGAWCAGGSIGAMGSVSMSEGLTGIILGIWVGVVGMVTVLTVDGAAKEAWSTYQQERRARIRTEEQRQAEEKAAQKAKKKAEREEKRAAKKAQKDTTTDDDQGDSGSAEVTEESADASPDTLPAASDAATDAATDADAAPDAAPDAATASDVDATD